MTFQPANVFTGSQPLQATHHISLKTPSIILDTETFSFELTEITVYAQFCQSCPREICGDDKNIQLWFI